MFRLTRAQVQPIGVDLGLDSVKMLQVEVVGDGLRVVAAAREPMPDDARRDARARAGAQAEAVRRLLRSGGFHGRRVVAALPREAVHVKNLRLPSIPAAELEAAVQFEAPNVFPLEAERSQVRFLSAGEVRQGNDQRQEVILFAAANDDVDGFVEHLHRAGAEVDSLDLEPCALYRGVERFIRRREDEQDVHVLVDVGWRRCHVVIGRGRDVVFYKPIEIGGRHLTDAVARKLAIAAPEAAALRRRLSETPLPPGEGDPAKGFRDPVRQAVSDATRATIEELGREVALCLRYYSVTFRGSRPTKLRLLGGEGCDPALQAALANTLPLPVEAGRPLHSVNTAVMTAADRRGTLGEWAVALGLGLRRTIGHFGARDGRPRGQLKPGDLDVGSGSQHLAALDRVVGGASTATVTTTPAAEVARA